MLTHPIAKYIWSKIAGASAEWYIVNVPLLAKSARIIYHKCGRQEAHQFIVLVRIAQIIGPQV